MKFAKKLILFVGIFWTATLSAESTITAEDLPPWLQPKLLVHIAAMEMNDAQNIILDKNTRKKLIKEGEKYAKLFLTYLKA